MVGHAGYVAVNAGRLALPGEFTDAATFAGRLRSNTETGLRAATGRPVRLSTGFYRLEFRAVFDCRRGVRLWGNLGVGVSVSLYDRGCRRQRLGPTLPHPFLRRTARTIDGGMPLSHE